MWHSVRVASVRFVPTRVAPWSLALLRLAPWSLALLRSAPLRKAPLRLALLRLASLRLASLSLALLRSGCSFECCFLHSFQAAVPCLSISRCSWFAMFFLLSFPAIIAIQGCLSKKYPRVLERSVKHARSQDCRLGNRYPGAQCLLCRKALST